ncbi:hypothetical protein PENTCL1PPCAC_29555, partial [Pristionchus entomophagus]
TNIRTWRKLALELALPSLLCFCLYVTIKKGLPTYKAGDTARSTGRYEEGLFGYETKIGLRQRGTETLKWICNDPTATDCEEIRGSVDKLCAEYACFAQEQEMKQYIRLSQFDGFNLHANFTNSELKAPDPSFVFASEEYEKPRKISPYPFNQFHRLYGTILAKNAKKLNHPATLGIKYFKDLEHNATSDSVLFDLADASTRNIAYMIILLIPVLPALNLASALGDERKSEIKKYLLTMGITRTTYLLHHVLTAFAKHFYFSFIVAIILFSPNFTFVWLFSLAYCLYILSCLAVAILITVFLQNPKLIPDVLLVILPCLLMMPLATHISRTRAFLSVVTCFNPGHALFNALDALRECSLKGGHLTWFTDFPYVLPFGLILLLQIFFTALLITLAIFLDHLVANSFNPMKWLSGYRKVTSDDEERVSLHIHEDEETFKKKISIEIKDVHKTYTSGERAVRGVNLDIFEKQNTILLGQNGAGKSTLFDLITGSALPTSGTININYPEPEYRYGERETKWERIGLCPQYSPIFPKLTVVEHLQFFALIGGERANGWIEKAEQFVDLLKLEQYKLEYAENLSGGNRRKLCIAMALSGRSDIILMDEPSAGVDTESRAIIKKFLNTLRGHTTLLITTHYTDEAEDLGDRVFIMAKGEIACSGTTTFLCEKMGAGYFLSCVVADRRLLDATAERTLRLAQDYLPASIRARHGEEFSLTISRSDNERMLAFTRELDNSKERIGITNIGWTTAPLEQVFLKVAEQTGSTVEREKVDRAVQLFLKKNDNRASKSRRIINSLAALLYKRFCFEWRNKFYQAFFFLIIIISMWSARRTTNFANPSAELNLLELRECGRIGFVNAAALSVRFREIASERGECLVVEEVSDLEAWHKNDHVRRPPIIGALTRTGEDYTLFMAQNRKIYEPWVATIFYRALNAFSGDIQLSFQRKPNITVNADNMRQLYMIIVFMMQTIAISRFIRAYVIEHESGYAHLQVLTGIPKYLYWTGHFIVDCLVYSIIYAYLAIVCTYFDVVPEALTELIGQNTLCLLITIIKLAIIYRWFDSKNTAAGMASMLLFLSIVLLLPLYVYLQGSAPKFSLEKSFPLFLDPFVAVIVYQFNLAPDGPNIYALLFGQLVVLLSIFICLESRSVRRFIVRTLNHNRKRDEGTKQNNNGGDVEMQPLSSRSGPDDESVEARPQGGVTRNIVLDAVNIKKRYGKKTLAVKGVTMAVEQNECFGLLGHNGAGKTTTFKILTGQCFADSGEATVSEVDCAKPAHIGYCPQDDALINQLTGKEHLAILAALHGFADPFKVAVILIDCVGMEQHCGKIFKNLSGGQKRKLSVCASILAMSKLIVLDEPTTGIDPMVRNDIWSLLRSIRDSTNTAIVLTSHSMTEVEALCSRVAVMKQGLIITHGSPQTIISTHGDFFKLEFRAPSSNPIEKEDQIRAIVDELLPTAVFSNRIINRYFFKIPRNPSDHQDYSRNYEVAFAIAGEVEAADFTLTQCNLEDTFLALSDTNQE